MIKKLTLIVGCILFACTLVPSLAVPQQMVISTSDPSGVCTVSCVQTVRYGHGELALVQVKDANGNVAYAKSVHLPLTAKLVSNSSSAQLPANTGLHATGTTQVTSTSTTQTYVTKNGTIIVIVTTVTYDSNGNILDVETQEYRIPAGTEVK